MEMRLRKVISLVTDLQYQVSSSNTNLKQHHVPPRMSPLRLIGATSSSVTLQWVPLEGENEDSSILGYVIQRDEASSALLPSYTDDIFIDKKRAVQARWVVDGLSPGKKYDFVICALNKAGMGRPSPPIRAAPLFIEKGNDKDDAALAMSAEDSESSSQEDPDLLHMGGESKDEDDKDSNMTGLTCNSARNKETDIGEKLTTQQLALEWLKNSLISLGNILETEDGKLDIEGSDAGGEGVVSNSLSPKSEENQWTTILVHAFLSQSGAAVAILLVLFAYLHSSLYAIFLPVSYFLYAIWQHPRPSTGYWNFLLGYILFTVVIRFVVQLPIFCFNLNNAAISLSIQPYCPHSDELYDLEQILHRGGVNNLHLFFLFKKDNSKFFGWLWVDLLIVLTIILHKQQLYKRGLWKMKSSYSTENEKLLSLVEKNGEKVLPISATYWQKAMLYLNQVFPMKDTDSRSTFDVSKAISLFDRDEEIEQPFGANKERSSRIIDPGISNTQLYTEMKLNEQDREFMRYVCNTLGSSTTLKPGKENYTLGTVAQMITCILVFFTPQMTDSRLNILSDTASTSTLSAITGNSPFDKQIVLMLMYHILIMIVDRTALLYQNLRLKFALHCIVTVICHLYIFIYVQMISDRWIQDNVLLLMYYLLQLMFLVSSGSQIRYGYCVFPTTGQTEDDDYNACSSVLYKLFRGVPLLHEMRSIFNWICAETSLDMFMWMQMDDLYATLAIVKYNMSYRERDSETLSGKNEQPFLWKFLYGWLIFAGFLLLLLGPIFAFSPLNPSTEPNSVLEASLAFSISVQSVESSTTNKLPSITYKTYQSVNQADIISVDPGTEIYKCFEEQADSYKFKQAIDTGEGSMQLIRFPSFSDSLWSLTPRAIVDLRERLLNSSFEMRLHMKYGFSRSKPIQQNIIGNDLSIDITKEHRCIMAARLGATNTSLHMALCNSTFIGNSSEVPLIFVDTEKDTNFYQPILRLPSTAADAQPIVMTKPRELFGIGLELKGSNTGNISQWTRDPVSHPDPTLWWSSKLKYAWPSDQCRDAEALRGGVVFAIFSDAAPAGAARAILSFLGGGLLPVYIFLVGTVATQVRYFLFNPIYNVPYSEIPYPERLLEICEGIQIMRVSGYEGHRRDEVVTYKFLLEVIRSSFLLSRLTNSRETMKIKEE